MYVLVCTCLDLAHVVCQVSKYMSKSGEQHWVAVKWIFRNLRCTVGCGIMFGGECGDVLVVG